MIRLKRIHGTINMIIIMQKNIQIKITTNKILSINSINKNKILMKMFMIRQVNKIKNNGIN